MGLTAEHQVMMSDIDISRIFCESLLIWGVLAGKRLCRGRVRGRGRGHLVAEFRGHLVAGRVVSQGLRFNKALVSVPSGFSAAKGSRTMFCPFKATKDRTFPTSDVLSLEGHN